MSENYKEYYQYLTKACLNITDACNLECKYCFVEQNPHYMSLQTAKDAIDWLYKNYCIKKNKFKDIIFEKNGVYVSFFGGEPTLLWEQIIKPLVTYSKEKYKDEIHFAITTNGTLLTMEKLEFLKENNFDLLFSFDGNKYTQDYNRPFHNMNISSFDTIIKNISNILLYYPNITCRGTIYADTVEQTFDNFLFLENLGFKNIFLLPDARHPQLWTEEKISILQEQFNKLYFYKLNQISNGQNSSECPLLDQSFQQALTILYKQYNKPINSVSRCGLGTTFGAIGYDGTIFGCQEQVSYGKEDIFNIGNIYSGIDVEKHKKLLNLFIDNDNEFSCDKNCFLYNLCKNNLITSCVSTNYDLISNLKRIPDFCCIYKKILINNALTCLSIANLDKNEKFKNYLLSLAKKGRDNNG